MKYRESLKDTRLRQKFTKDMSHASLRNILLREGELRGINSLDIFFNYPITAIAGKNGAGKSTILALACCAYHNTKTGFKLPKRKTSYYTFSDFFVQHTEEIPPQGIDIRYGIAHDNWKKSPELPDGVGVAYQRRWKRKEGKWNDYAERVRRNVVFLGIDRIVPHSERSQSRSYSKAFKGTKSKGWEDKVKDAVGFILGKHYDEFLYLEYTKYSLPLVRVGGTIYSGFNMGAGENALFEIFSTIYSCGDGALLVMDEVELGLHAEAQRKFIEKLKDVCLETHTQVICTTHSKEIFDCLPYDARFFVECVNGKTIITEAISSEFAFSKMSAITGNEMTIYVEDKVAQSILLASLPASLRQRLNIAIIGSATALARQLAALYVRGDERPTLAIFDGDQQSKEQDNLDHAKRMAETDNDDFSAWFKEHLFYLPGETWPEAWLVQKGTGCVKALSYLLSANTDNLVDILKSGMRAGKHNEFHEISKSLGLDKQTCLQLFTTGVTQNFPAEFQPLIKRIEEMLASNS